MSGIFPWYDFPANWRITLPETNSSHLKIGHPKRKLVFQTSIFRCELLVLGRVYATYQSDLLGEPETTTIELLGRDDSDGWDVLIVGGGNWGTLRIPREDWGTLGNIRED